MMTLHLQILAMMMMKINRKMISLNTIIKKNTVQEKNIMLMVIIQKIWISVRTVKIKKLQICKHYLNFCRVRQIYKRITMMKVSKTIVNLKNRKFKMMKNLS